MKIFYSLILFNILYGQLLAQAPIVLMESTFKINRFNKESFQFGFCEGDKIQLEFSEKNSNTVQQLTINEMEGNLIFQDFKITDISKKEINISKTAIYEITIKNNSASKRICYLNITRLPQSEATVNFNTTVYSRTIRDTTFKAKKKPYVRYAGQKAVQLVENNIFFLNGKTGAFLTSGNSKIIIPVNLPINTVEWYYQFSSYRDRERMEEVRKGFNLLGKISKIFDKSGVTNLAIKLLTQPPGGDICSIYLLDESNTHAFKNSSSWSYQLSGSRENCISGIAQIKQLGGTTQYLGVQNPDPFNGINVTVEVVAIVADFDTGIEEVQKPIIKTRQEFYLKN